MSCSPPGSAAATRYVGRIPIRNLWLLMLFASDLYRDQAGSAGAGAEQADEDTADLVGHILVKAAEQRLRRQLTLRFAPEARVLARVRGRIDLLRTMRRRLPQRGRVACRFDALSIDTPRNRLIHAALALIARIAGDPVVRQQSHGLATAMRRAGVGATAPIASELARDSFSVTDRNDRKVVTAARLALALQLPVDGASTEPLPAPDTEERWVRHLFERAVGGFYDSTLKAAGWDVHRSKHLHWQVDRRTLTPHLNAILPDMQTDIVLDQPSVGRRIVIDTKFASIVQPGWHRASTLKSGYLYQIYAYLQSQVGRPDDELAAHAEGVLLHPAIDERVDEHVIIQGHTIRFYTVNLAGSSADIRWQLRQAVAGVVACGEARPVGN